MVQFRFEVEGEVQLNRFIDHFADQLTDWRPVWDDVAKEFWQVQEKHFDTQGHGAWAPLSPRYAAWKAMNYPGRDILVREGTLRDAATGKQSIERRQAMTLGLGWSGVSYWRYHQRGTSNMPARKVIDLREQDRQAILKAAHRGMVRALGRLRK
jgi:phage gpG-like protein